MLGYHPNRKTGNAFHLITLGGVSIYAWIVGLFVLASIPINPLIIILLPIFYLIDRERIKRLKKGSPISLNTWVLKNRDRFLLGLILEESKKIRAKNGYYRN